MKYYLILLILAIVGCTPNVPPSPTPIPPKVMEFTINGTTVTLTGKIKTNSTLTAEEAQKQLAVAVELIDK